MISVDARRLFAGASVAWALVIASAAWAFAIASAVWGFAIASTAIVIVVSVSAARADAAAPAPSFPCAAASNHVEHAICASERLAALDRALAQTYGDMLGQGGIDAKALRAQEDGWRTNVRDRCTTDECIAAAYEARNAALLDESRYAASPAAYEDTRPYPSSSAAFAAAHALIGTSCAARFTNASGVFGSFAAPQGAPAEILPVVYRDATIVTRQRNAERFAFLLAGDPAHCRIADAVALPTPAQATSVLQCRFASGDGYGFGMGSGAHHALIAFWTIQTVPKPAFERQPIHVLGVESVKCQQPETGE